MGMGAWLVVDLDLVAAQCCSYFVFRNFCCAVIFRLQTKRGKAYITEGSRVVSYLNTNSARWCLTSLFEMGRGGSTIV